MTEIHVQQGESSVAVSVGDLVVVRLVEPGATGYQWATDLVGDPVVEEFSRLQVEGADPAPGRSAARLVGLRAVGPGRAQVVFSLRRAWEKAEPVEVEHLRVDVT
ncbi:MAG TPA: protease inhibitor I42 family protein [Candidatus Limnocylindria bacterium]|nr:protease inhibitor I42 family protein [Candidatus Limnocylindria bacterium]